MREVFVSMLYKSIAILLAGFAVLFAATHAYAKNFEKKCESGVYRYVSENTLSPETFYMKLYIGEAIPKDISNLVKNNLGSISKYYEISSYLKEVRTVKLFEACAQMGITFCAMDDFEQFKSRGAHKSLGVFEVVHLYESEEGLSNIRASKLQHPSKIYFDDSSLFYFARGDGNYLLKEINSKNVVVYPKDFTAWVFSSCI